MIIDGNTYYKIANGLVANDGIILPSEYQRVEYIANDGYNYLSTVIALNKLFVFDIQYLDNNSRYLMGIAPSASEFFGNNNGVWEKVGTNGTNKTTLDRVRIYYDVGNITENKVNTWIEGATNKYEGGSTNFYNYANRNFSFFRVTSTYFLCNCKLFNVKVYNASNVLLNNFIPCYRKSDSEIGMYDVVEGVFYTNQYTGTFLKGNDIKPYYNIKAVPYDAEIEYLESDGNQHIETNFVPNQDTSVNVIFKLKHIGNAGATTGSIIYSGGQGYNNKTKEIYTNANKLEINCGNAYKYSNISINTTDIFEIENNKNIYTIKNLNTQSTDTVSHDYTTFTAPYSIWLYAFHRKNEVMPEFAGKGAIIYKCSIKDNNTLARDFIPVRKGNVGYMYDKVSGKLFGNSGTGNFILGPDKEETPYISGHVTDGSSTFTFKITNSKIVSTNIDSNGNWKWYVDTDVTNLSDSFKLKSALTKIYSNYNFKNCITLYGAFTDAQTLQEIIFPKATFENVTSFAYMLNRAYALKRLIMPNATFINITQSSNMFINASNLEDVEIKSFINSINFSWQSKLTKQSVLNIINAAAANVTYTLHSTVYNKCASGGEWYSDIQAAIDAKAQQGYTVTLISA